MKSIQFPGATIQIGKDQPEYNVIHAMPGANTEAGEVIACFELSEEELQEVMKTKRIYYSRLTFHQPFQPMKIFTSLDEGIEFIQG